MTQAYWASALANHLWQSTALVFAAWLLALALKKNQARTRYWIWLIASLKFLVPFSLLIAFGKYVGSKIVAPVAHPALSSVMEQITQPFPQTQSIAYAAPAAAVHNGNFLPILLLFLWLFGSLVLAFNWWRKWRQIRVAVRASSPWLLSAAVPVLASPSQLEPGIFGIFHPVLLLPEGIEDRLTPAQMQAVIAHEMCHVRRRDNLTFALHIVVETLFWFHPLVWWIGNRLIEEREHACDEAVLQMGSEAEVYAESILNVCKFCIESPLACVSGVSGADLKKRIVRIMTQHVVRRLDFNRKLLLGAAALLAVAVPVVSGLARASQSRAESQAEDSTTNVPRFEVASIRPNKSDDGMIRIMNNGDGISYTGVPTQMLLRLAFGVEDDRIFGVSGWVKTDPYNIEAKVGELDIPVWKKLPRDQRGLPILQLLVDRFGLKYHHETRELSMYALVIAKNGPRFQEAKPGDTYPNGAKGPDGHTGAGMMLVQNGKMTGQGIPVSGLINMLSMQLAAHTIVDKTGLTGKYDFVVQFAPENRALPMDGGPDGGQPRNDASTDSGPSLFTALQEQLGLKLELQKEPVDVIVIDHIERPSEN